MGWAPGVRKKYYKPLPPPFDLICGTKVTLQAPYDLPHPWPTQTESTKYHDKKKNRRENKGIRHIRKHGEKKIYIEKKIREKTNKQKKKILRKKTRKLKQGI